MAKKSSKGQINFFRTMAIIGIVVTILVIKEFLNAAPALPTSEAHKGPPRTKACLECHDKATENIPIMPHRPIENCTFCHKPTGNN